MVAAALIVALLGAADTTAPPPEPRFDWAALPIINYTSDFGLGLGARGSLYRFAEHRLPFELEIDLQIFANTGGVQTHFLSVDLPALAGSAYRLTVVGLYQRNLASPWYGIGNHALPDAQQPADFYRYDAQSPFVRALIRRALVGKLFAFGSYLLEGDRIRFYPGSLAEGQGLPGAAGGVFSVLGVGVLYDSRDNEGSPTSGALLELSGRTAQPFLGSTSQMGGVFAGATRYLSPIERVVLAGRLALDQQWGAVPFNHLGDFGWAFPINAVGGGNSVRGLLDTEYVGPTKAIANLEARVHLLGWKWLREDFALGVVTFLDGGRVWAPGAADPPGPNIHLGFGGGLRFRWGELFVVRADVGFSPGVTRAYVDVGQSF